jgi:DNA-binding LytR/AlgR family response regulator
MATVRKIWLLEDEPLAAERFARILKQIRPEWLIVQHSERVDDALDYLKLDADYDAIFSDIQLTGGQSFEVLAELPDDRNIPVVFLTAYDEYALRAFEHFSLDYLLKPTSEKEVRRAIDKLEHHWNNRDEDPTNSLRALLEHFTRTKRTYKTRFSVRLGEKSKFFEVLEILYFFSEEKATYLVSRDHRRHLIDHTLEQVVDMVDPARYFKVNRAYLVSAEALTEISAHSNSRWRLVLSGDATQPVVVARERSAEFKAWLDR